MIFDELKPKKNVLLSEMNDNDLKYIITLINSFYLQLRNQIKIDSNSTFGLEVEFNSNSRQDFTIFDLSEEFNSKHFKTFSATQDCEKVEVNSGILRNQIKTWKSIKEVLDIVKSYGTIAENCSGHVNIGTQILGDDNKTWLNFVLLWASYEDIIFRFTSGEFKSIRLRANYYAKPVAYKYKEFFEQIQESLKTNPLLLKECDTKTFIYKINTLFTKYFGPVDRYTSVNLFRATNPKKCEFANVIEFRCPNASLDAVIWQNNINFFIKFLNYCKRHDFDYETILKRLIAVKKCSILEYNEINLKKAIELGDLIFDNNLDKVYFLRQYIKSFTTSRNEREKAKQFTINS